MKLVKFSAFAFALSCALPCFADGMYPAEPEEPLPQRRVVQETPAPVIEEPAPPAYEPPAPEPTPEVRIEEPMKIESKPAAKIDENRWTFGIVPGLYAPADKDFDQDFVFSIGGFAHYRLADDRNLELEAQYSAIEMDSTQMVGTTGDTDGARWTVGVNHIWWSGANKIHHKGFHWGLGVHYEAFDLSSSFISGDDNDEGIGGKVFIGYNWDRQWGARLGYLVGGTGETKRVSGDDFNRGGLEFQVNYLF